MVKIVLYINKDKIYNIFSKCIKKQKKENKPYNQNITKQKGNKMKNLNLELMKMANNKIVELKALKSINLLKCNNIEKELINKEINKIEEFLEVNNFIFKRVINTLGGVKC